MKQYLALVCGSALMFSCATRRSSLESTAFDKAGSKAPGQTSDVPEVLPSAVLVKVPLEKKGGFFGIGRPKQESPRQVCEAAAVSERVLLTSAACLIDELNNQGSLAVSFRFATGQGTAQFTQPVPVSTVYMRRHAEKPRNAKVTETDADDDVKEDEESASMDSSIAVLELDPPEEGPASKEPSSSDIGCDRWVAALRIKDYGQAFKVTSPFMLKEEDMDLTTVVTDNESQARGATVGVALSIAQIPVVVLGKKPDHSAYLMTPPPGAKSVRDWGVRRGAAVVGRYRNAEQAPEVLKGIVLQEMPDKPGTLEVASTEGCLANIRRLVLESSLQEVGSTQEP